MEYRETFGRQRSSRTWSVCATCTRVEEVVVEQFRMLDEIYPRILKVIWYILGYFVFL